MTKAKSGQPFLHVILETIPRLVRHLREELMARVDGSFENSVAWIVIWTWDFGQIIVDREFVLSLSMSSWFRSNIVICLF